MTWRQAVQYLVTIPYSSGDFFGPEAALMVKPLRLG